MSRRAGSGWRAAVAIVLVGVLLGAIAGAVWWLVAPEVQGQPTDSGVSVPISEAARQFGRVGWFALAAAAGGLLHGVLALGLHRGRPGPALAALLAGGLLGAVVAWRVGVALSSVAAGEPGAGTGTGALVTAPLALSAPAALLLLWPIAAMVGAIAATALTHDGTGPAQ